MHEHVAKTMWKTQLLTEGPGQPQNIASGLFPEAVGEPFREDKINTSPRSSSSSLRQAKVELVSGPKSIEESGEAIIVNTELLANILYCRSNDRIMLGVDARKDMVLDLKVQTDAEEVPKHRAHGPIRGRLDLSRRPRFGLAVGVDFGNTIMSVLVEVIDLGEEAIQPTREDNLSDDPYDPRFDAKIEHRREDHEQVE